MNSRILRAIAIDDETLGLERLKDLIDHQQTLKYMEGIKLGEKINQLQPAAILVYVTAYESYALDAYNNFAFTYLLKPVTHGQITEFKTRQKAMVMISNAMERINLSEEDLQRIKTCDDYYLFSTWAVDLAAPAIGRKIFNGVGDNRLAPHSSFTYAEAVIAIDNMLKAASLID